MEAKQDSRRYFPVDFPEARSWFHRRLEKFRLDYPHLESGENPITAAAGKAGEELAVEWVHIPARKKAQDLLILTAGEHGMEGFVGTAMLEMFVEEYLPRLNLETTGILIIPWINPWGMSHARRTNACNVDLNRNFLYDDNFFNERSKAYNPDYAKINRFINPKKKIHTLFGLRMRQAFFIFKVIWNILTAGQTAVRTATLLGQYCFPQGIYYGGEAVQAETRILMDFYRHFFGIYDRIIHLDMHTGYGPHNQMSIVNSSLENRSSELLREVFHYPMVVKSNPTEFYAMQGDMIDFEYHLAYNEFPGKTIYATSFEFGTLGDTLTARMNSLQTMVLENQIYHHGAGDGQVREEVTKLFADLYYPSDAAWREKALKDGRAAFSGIFQAEGLIS